MIAPTCVVSTPPAMSGGAIADGTYVLVSATDYASSCSGVPLPGGGPMTILVSAGCLQSIDTTDGAQTYTWTTSGNAFVLDLVCPGMFSADVQYAATPTTLSWLQPFTAGISLVLVFHKQ